MKLLRLYHEVRVVKILRPLDEYNGWGMNKRPPEIGDTGTYIDLLRAPDVPDHYVVENSDTDGSDIWLSEFLIDEIEEV